MSDDFLKITFVPTREDYDGKILPPSPSYKHVPEWYRSLSKFGRSNNEMHATPKNHVGTDGAQVSTKMCMPFFDATVAGYMHLLDNDLYIDLDENGMPSISWDGEVMLIDKRPILDLPVPDNCHPIHYGWRMSWYYETPPGYSVLITHPMNRYDLPFYVQSGIVDSDTWGLPVFITVFFKRNFRGLIPKGTPIFQMIPIKRDNWEMEINDSPEEIDRHELMAENRRSMLFGYYKKTAWRKKIFRALVGKSRKK
jgi:hypothetical protein